MILHQQNFEKRQIDVIDISHTKIVLFRSINQKLLSLRLHICIRDTYHLSLSEFLRGFN